MPRPPKIPKFSPQPWLGPVMSDTELETDAESKSIYPESLSDSVTSSSMDTSGYPDSAHNSENEHEGEENYDPDPQMLNDIGSFLPNWSNDDEDDEYEKILDEFRKKWMVAEITHKVSKSASNSFWELAMHFFPLLLAFDNNKKMVKFPQQRKILHESYVPRILMNIAYQEKKTEKYHTLNNVTVIPISQFPPSKFTKIYEIATVQVT